MHANETVPQPAPGAPGIHIPEEMPPLIVPPEPGLPPEINDPVPPEPKLPIREPGTRSPPQAL